MELKKLPGQKYNIGDEVVVIISHRAKSKPSRIVRRYYNFDYGTDSDDCMIYVL